MAAIEDLVAWEGEGLLVLDKPAGLAATGRTLDDPDCLQWQLGRSRGRMVWAVHQLDAETSGAIVFATRRSAVAEAARRLRPPGGKSYLAVCRGEPGFERRTVREPIASRALAAGGVRHEVSPDGRSAITRLRVVAAAGGFAIVEARPVTGRTHQLRIHLAHLGLPLVGERRYQDVACTLLGRHALHASAIALAPGAGGSGVRIALPLPPDMAELCARLGFPVPGPARASVTAD